MLNSDYRSRRLSRHKGANWILMFIVMIITSTIFDGIVIVKYHCISHSGLCVHISSPLEQAPSVSRDSTLLHLIDLVLIIWNIFWLHLYAQVHPRGSARVRHNDIIVLPPCSLDYFFAPSLRHWQNCASYSE